jgi:hypothetical protein
MDGCVYIRLLLTLQNHMLLRNDDTSCMFILLIICMLIGILLHVLILFIQAEHVIFGTERI